MLTHQHFILHKPYGYLSQFVYELKRKKKLLGELYNFPVGTMANKKKSHRSRTKGFTYGI